MAKIPDAYWTRLTHYLEAKFPEVRDKIKVEKPKQTSKQESSQVKEVVAVGE